MGTSHTVDICSKVIHSREEIVVSFEGAVEAELRW